MSKHFGLESLIKKNYFDEDEEGRVEEEQAKSDKDSFEIIDSIT